MSKSQHRPFLAWPGWAHLRAAWLLTALVSMWFVIVYAGADFLTGRSQRYVRVHLDAELHLPMVPAFTVVYMSIYLLFLAVPFVLRTEREIRELAAAQAVAILTAGISFLLFPSRLAYPKPSDVDLGMWKPLFDFADRLNLDYNLVPSLHVALSVVCIEMFCIHAHTSGKLLLRGWAILIAASTLLTHQHHALDAITGWILAVLMVALTRRVTHSKKLVAPSKLTMGLFRDSA